MNKSELRLITKIGEIGTYVAELKAENKALKSENKFLREQVLAFTKK